MINRKAETDAALNDLARASWAFVMSMIAGATNVLIDGYVLLKVWQWHVGPWLNQSNIIIPPPSFSMLCVLSMIPMVLTYRPSLVRDQNTSPFIIWLSSAFASLAVLFAAWLAHN